MKVLMFAAALRKDSYNKKLIHLVEKLTKEQGCQIDRADFAEFSVPLYDGDLETAQGLPSGCHAFMERLKKADALIISTPEYNHSTPGTLKNLIDWASRANPNPFAKVPTLLLSASPSLVGGNRGLWATRIPFEYCGAYLYPGMFSLATANDAFQEDGDLKDSKTQQRLQKMLAEFKEYAEALKK